MTEPFGPFTFLAQKFWMPASTLKWQKHDFILTLDFISSLICMLQPWRLLQLARPGLERPGGFKFAITT